MREEVVLVRAAMQPRRSTNEPTKKQLATADDDDVDYEVLLRLLLRRN